MIQDAFGLFSDAQDITATASSTNVVDLGTERRFGTGEPVYLVATVTTAFTDSSSNSTVTVTLQSAAAATMASATTRLTLPVFAAESAAGTKQIGVVPPGALNERYYNVKYTVANGDLTTGAFDTFFTLDPDTNDFGGYPDNVTITTS
jgi:hypothetical protein